MVTISSIVAFVEASKYLLLFLGSFFEGTSIMIAGGVLWHLGTVDFWPMYGALFAGDVLADLCWYLFGYYGARPALLRWGHFLNATPATIDRIEEKFRRYQLRILIISKLTMGFGFAALILATAGMLRVSLTRYLTINVLCGFVWVTFIVFIGYYFGDVFRFIPKDLHIPFAVALIVAVFGVLRLISKRLEKIVW